MKHKLLSLVIMTCLSSAAMAEGLKGYIGIGGGSSSAKDDTTSETYSASTGSLFGGVKFNENIAVEAEYISASKFDFGPGSMDVSGFGVSAVLSQPVGNWFFFGKLGMASLTTKLSANAGYVLLVPAEESKTGVSYGVGAGYSFTSNLALRLSYTSYEVSAGAGALTGRMGTFLVSGLYNF